MSRLLWILSLSTLGLVARADAGIDLENTTFFGVASASIHCIVHLDEVTVDYEGPVSLEMTTRVEVSSGFSWCPRVSYLNVRFAFMTLDSADVRVATTGEHRKSVVHFFSSRSGDSLGWPEAVIVDCTQQQQPYCYVGMRSPEAMGESTQEFRLNEFEKTDSGSFRLNLRPYDSAWLVSGESLLLSPAGYGSVLLVGEGAVAATTSTWGLMKQRFMK
jgi:hypothetical protein